MTRVCLLIFGALLAAAAAGLRAGAADPPPAEESSLDQEIAELQRTIAAKRAEADALSAKLQALLKQRREKLAAAKPLAIEPDERLTISSITPNEGAAGAMLTLRGKGFAGTKKVTFLLFDRYGGLDKDAVFTVISDEELSVIAPDILQAGLSFSILLKSDAGVTITVPGHETKIVDNKPNVNRVGARFGDLANYGHPCVIRKGGITEVGGVVTLVENGGVLLPVSYPIEVALVRNGGRMAIDNGRGLSNRPAARVIYHEPDAKLDGTVAEYHNLVKVPAVTLSPVKSLFTYTEPQHAKGESKTPPKISSVTPNDGQSGDTLTINGEGFLGTEAVMFLNINDDGNCSNLGFQVISDETMRVQVHRSTGLFVIQTPKGLTFTFPKDTAKFDGAGKALRQVNWIVDGGIASMVGNVSLIDQGGIVLRGHHTCFVKDGASIRGADNDAWIFHEPKAELGENIRQAALNEDRSGRLKLIEVPVIEPSFVDEYFNAPEKD